MNLRHARGDLVMERKPETRQNEWETETRRASHHISVNADFKVSFPLPLEGGGWGKCYPEEYFFFLTSQRLKDPKAISLGISN